MTVDGSVYKGNWKNGKRNGKGVEISPDGVIEDVVFDMGIKKPNL